jgi:secreted trypsin-like serine protease
MAFDHLIREMKILVAFASIAIATSTGCAAESGEDSGDGNVASTQQAITNGEDEDGDTAVVALMAGGKVYCTGVLISANVVATAAHCVAPTPPEQIYFGVRPNSKKGTFIDVSDSKLHPDFDEDTLTNDIAVVGLARKAPVAPMELLTSPFDSTFKGLPIRLVGFGLTTDDEDPVRKRSGTTTIFSYSDEDFRFRPSPSQTCSGDSGGPALMEVDGKDAVVGIASSGDAACSSYGRHIRVDANLEFLQSYAKRYAKHKTAAPMESSGCSMTTRAQSGSSTAALALALTFAAAAYARRRRVAD